MKEKVYTHRNQKWQNFVLNYLYEMRYTERREKGEKSRPNFEGSECVVYFTFEITFLRYESF